jgi:hypothetical protein
LRIHEDDEAPQRATGPVDPFAHDLKPDHGLVVVGLGNLNPYRNVGQEDVDHLRERRHARRKAEGDGQQRSGLAGRPFFFICEIGPAAPFGRFGTRSL